MMWTFLKVFSDICLCYSVLAGFPKMFYADYSYLIVAALGAFGAGVSAGCVQRGNYEMRFLGCVFPLSIILLVSDGVSLLTLAPAVIYPVLVIIRGVNSLEYYSYRRSFARTILVWCLIFGALWLATSIDGMALEGHGTFAFEGSLGYGVVFLLSGVILQRMLRIGEDGSSEAKRLNDIQAGVLMAFTGGTLMGTMYINERYPEAVKAVLNCFGMVLQFFFSLPIILITRIFDLFVKMEEDFKEEIKDIYSKTTEEPNPMQSAIGQAVEEFENKPQQEESYPWVAAILIVAVVLVLLVLCMLVLRRRRAVRQAQQEDAVDVQPEKTSRSNPRSNRAKVRRYYREYLRLAKRRGFRLRISHTSQDVLPGAPGVGAEELRRIYLAARYDLTRDVTDSQVRKAKAALQRAKSENSV